jgi:phosphoenolpyruvate carboxykinase (ATP)
MSQSISLSSYGITVSNVKRNASPASLYEDGVLNDGSTIVASGAIATDSAAKKGRSPNDKRVVEEASSKDDIWWGKINVPFSEDSFAKNLLEWLLLDNLYDSCQAREARTAVECLSSRLEE